MKALVNGRIILKDKIVENKAVLFSDKIESIISSDLIPENTEIIDVNGAYISPGFIDCHIHGYKGVDFCDGEESTVKTVAEELVKNGVTAFLPTTMTESIDTIEKAFSAIRKYKEKENPKGAEVIGVHAEGPFISPDKKGAQDIKYILKPDSSFAEKNKDIIKIITLAPEEDEGFNEIRKIKENTDIVISIGHTNCDYETAKGSFKAGVSSATHLFNAMSPLNHRNPGAVGAVLDSDIYSEIIADNIHVSSALYNILWKLKKRKLCIVTDCLSAGGLGKGEFLLGGQKIICDENLCRLSDGTIAGSVLNLNKGVFNVYKNSDIPLCECVNCASLNPATLLGISDKKGSVEKGKDADMAILDDEFNCLMTIKNGKIIYKKD